MPQRHTRRRGCREGRRRGAPSTARSRSRVGGPDVLLRSSNGGPGRRSRSWCGSRRCRPVSTNQVMNRRSGSVAGIPVVVGAVVGLDRRRVDRRRMIKLPTSRGSVVTGGSTMSSVASGRSTVRRRSSGSCSGNRGRRWADERRGRREPQRGRSRPPSPVSTPLSIVSEIWIGNPFVQLSRSGCPGSIPPQTAVSSAGSIEFVNDAVGAVPRSKEGTPGRPGARRASSSVTRQG